MTNKNIFLDTLQKQARMQSKINASHVLPKQLDFFTALIGNFPWQTLLLLSGITAFLVTLGGLL